MIDTTSPSGTPALNQPTFVCPHELCGAVAQQSWSALTHETGHGQYDGPWHEFLEPDDGPPSSSEGAVWRCARCGACQRWSFWRAGEMVYPVRRRLGGLAHRDMPGPVQELYEEAAAVAAVSRRAGAALARATIERLIKRLDPEAPKKAKLDERIGRLRARVSTPLAQMLDVVRVVGNGALHVDEQPPELVVIALDDTSGPELIELLLQVANDLVDELITRPRTARSYWDRLPDGVRARLGQRDAPAPVPGGQG